MNNFLLVFRRYFSYNKGALTPKRQCAKTRSLHPPILVILMRHKTVFIIFINIHKYRIIISTHYHIYSLCYFL
jgi:hypothetical protein